MGDGDAILPDPLALRLLVALSEESSLAAAARACGMSQPNASRSIQRLERRLGMPLVIRRTSGAQLTSGGVVAADRARDVLAAYTTLTDAVAALTTHESATLAVTSSQTIAEYLLPTWVSALQAQSWSQERTGVPISITIRVGNTTDVIADLQGGRADIGFVEGPHKPPGVNSVVVGNDHLVLAVAPEHPWAKRLDPVSAHELAATPLILREAGSGTRLALARALDPLVATRPFMELQSNAAIRVAAAAGSAPAVLSELAVAEAVYRGQLVTIRTTGLKTTRRLRGAWVGPRDLRGPARALIEIARTAPLDREGRAFRRIE